MYSSHGHGIQTITPYIFTVGIVDKTKTIKLSCHVCIESPNTHVAHSDEIMALNPPIFMLLVLCRHCYGSMHDIINITRVFKKKLALIFDERYVPSYVYHGGSK